MPIRRTHDWRTTALRAASDDPVTVVRAGRVGYGAAWSWQRQLAEARAAGHVGDVLLLLEHRAVYTGGRQADPANLRYDEAERAARGIELFAVDRGGDFTYHGPGQVVGYPVMRLSGPRVVDYVRGLEEVNIRLLATYGVEGHRVARYTGVWVGGVAADGGPAPGAAKVTAIGVRVLASRVTQHGWATNVDTRLEDFDGIVPCGIRDRDVTSLRALGVSTSMEQAFDRTEEAFAAVFGASLRTASPSDLGLEPVGAGPA